MAVHYILNHSLCLEPVSCKKISLGAAEQGKVQLVNFLPKLVKADGNLNFHLSSLLPTLNFHNPSSSATTNLLRLLCFESTSSFLIYSNPLVPFDFVNLVP